MSCCNCEPYCGGNHECPCSYGCEEDNCAPCDELWQEQREIEHAGCHGITHKSPPGRYYIADAGVSEKVVQHILTSCKGDCGFP